MSDSHASRSFRKGAPKGTRHRGPDKTGPGSRSDPSVYARLAADLDSKPKSASGKKALKYFKLAQNKAARESRGTKP